MNSRYDIINWLGPAAGQATDEQVEQLVEAANTINARWPDPDDSDTREQVLSGAAQIVLGDDTLEGLAEAWHRARRIERDHMAALTGALIVTPGSERELCERTGVARMTVRKALGKA